MPRRTACLAACASLALLTAGLPVGATGLAPPAPVVSSTLASGEYHSLVIGPEGRVYGAGSNSEGRVMPPFALHSPALRTLTPLDWLPGGRRAAAVAVGYNHSVVLATDGAVYTAGSDSSGQLGDGGTSSTNPATWTPVSGLPAGVRGRAIAANTHLTVVAGSNGKVYGAGINRPVGSSYGALTGTAELYGSMHELTGLPPGVRAVSIAAAYRALGATASHHVLVLASDRKVYGTGANDQGQLGTVATTGVSTLTPLAGLPAGGATAIAANGRSSYVVVGGRAYVTGVFRNYATPTGADAVTAPRLVSTTTANASVVGLGAGTNHVMLLRGNGELHATGFNGSAQFGVPATAPAGFYQTESLVRIAATVGPVAEVTCGAQGVLVRGRSGLIWGAGDGWLGKLTGTDDVVDAFTPLSGQVNRVTKAPSVAGAATPGTTVTAVGTTWFVRPQTSTYQWLRNGAVIPGARASTYRLTTADAGRVVSVRVTATHPNIATAVSTTSATRPIAVHATARATTKGTAKVGKKLRVRSKGVWAGAPTAHSYRWLRNGKPIKKATKKTYKLVRKDQRKRISVRVTATRAGFPSGVTTSAKTKKVKKR